MSCCDNIAALDDAALLERYLVDGDETAIAILYQRYRGSLYGYAKNQLRNEADARDLAQDAWEAILTFRGLNPAGNFRGLLFAIAHNLVRTWRHHQRRERKGRDAFTFAGAAIQAGAAYPGPSHDLLRRPVDGTCSYCGPGSKAREGQTLCHAHAMRRSRGATEEEMKRPIRRNRKRKATT